MPAQRLKAKLFHPPNTNDVCWCTWIAVLRNRKEGVEEGEAGSSSSSPFNLRLTALVFEYLALTLSVEHKLRVVAGVRDNEALVFRWWLA